MENFLAYIFGIPAVHAQTAATAEKTTSSSVNVLGFILENLPLWITAIVVLIVAILIGYVLKGVVENRLAKQITEEHQEVLIISGRLTFLGVTIIGSTIALAIAGINITNLLAAVGFGISFGLQDTIANFVAGIALLASRPFTIGDWIKVNGKMGKVVTVRTRATYLNTFDGLRLIVPNSQLYKSQVISYTSNPMRRMKVPVYARYGVDLKDVFKICMNVVKSDPKIFLEPKPNIVLIDFADYYIYLELRFWVDSKSMWRRIQSEVFRKIQASLEEAGLDSPYPTTSLTFDQDDNETFMKARVLDPQEMEKIMKQRMAHQEELDKRREELIKTRIIQEQVQAPDQTGAAFLKVTTIPLPATAQLQQKTMQAAQPQSTAQKVTQSQAPAQPAFQPQEQPETKSVPLPAEPLDNPQGPTNK